MDNQEKASLLLDALLQMKRKPVGIKFLLDAESYETSPLTPTSRMASYCTFVKQACKGRVVKLTLDNLSCMGGAMALGFVKPRSSVVSGQRRYANGSYKDLCISRNISRNMLYCQQELYGVAVAPLESYREPPDIVILVTNAVDAMRVLQGNAYHNGNDTRPRLVGMQAICHECTSYPFETNTINLSMMCPGTRMLANWDDDELGIGIPFNKLDTLIDGIRSTVNPFERNRAKARIEERLARSNLQDVLTIVYDKNYDDGAYTGISKQK
ncbi:hypothetical protein DSCW_12220 [Desulfosarcina widdelii]|uniref:DUF169 domain-containing protein n=1 Tax=Desulfosarcina widdelii TaxID=947919 RepID=A0A5K7YZF4_9BACT|nr:DUF169 domain-containing protein [Desulfosarcina widdelii]BBO73805.1 hypothetical protein DSCW_12220 [Desulfosarcina widdelii]